MNRRVLVAGLVVVVPLLVILVANLGRNPTIVASPLVGRPAPPFSLARVGGGEPVSLEALRGSPVVINFWASYCIPCFEEHGVLAAAARSLPDVQFLGVIYQDREEEVIRFLRARGSAYPSLLDPDGKTAIAYGVFGVPETFFIDGQGRIAAKFVGPLTYESLAANLAKATGPRTADAETAGS